MLLVAVSTLLALSVLPQRLDPPPRVTHPGETVVVRAVDREGKPARGVAVRVRVPSGELRDVGVADARGEVRFAATDPGEHEFRAQFPDGPEVIAVHFVVTESRRWLYALLLTPLGLGIVWWNLSKLRPRKE